MKITGRDDVTRALNKAVFDGGTPLAVWLGAYELWAIETALKRYPSIEAAARSLGMSRRQFSYRLKQNGAGWTGDVDEKSGGE